MTEDETFTGTEWDWNFLVFIGGIFSAAILFINGQREYGLAIGVLAMLFIVHSFSYRKAAKSATLKTDTLQLDEFEVPYEDIVQAGFLSLRRGKFIYVKTRNRRIELLSNDYSRFFESLAARMETKGIKIRKERFIVWNDIREIINLDAKEKR
jgi:hypothetical protein